MKNFGLVLIGCACGLLASCGGKDATTEGSKKQDSASPRGKPAELIIGRWEGTDKQPHLEFSKGGTLKLGDSEKDKLVMTGKYTFEDEETITIILNDPIKLGETAKPEKLKITVTQDELTTTDSKGKVEKFKRKK